MDDEFKDWISTENDEKITVEISHHRDRIVFDGKIAQDYRFLDYVFPGKHGAVEARMYLDDERIVKISLPLYGTAVPEAVLHYLQRRFQSIDQLSNSQGYVEIWKSKKLK